MSDRKSLKDVVGNIGNFYEAVEKFNDIVDQNNSAGNSFLQLEQEMSKKELLCCVFYLIHKQPDPIDTLKSFLMDSLIEKSSHHD